MRRAPAAGFVVAVALGCRPTPSLNITTEGVPASITRLAALPIEEGRLGSGTGLAKRDSAELFYVPDWAGEQAVVVGYDESLLAYGGLAPGFESAPFVEADPATLPAPGFVGEVDETGALTATERSVSLGVSWASECPWVPESGPIDLECVQCWPSWTRTGCEVHADFSSCTIDDQRWHATPEGTFTSVGHPECDPTPTSGLGGAKCDLGRLTPCGLHLHRPSEGPVGQVVTLPLLLRPGSAPRSAARLGGGQVIVASPNEDQGVTELSTLQEEPFALVGTATVGGLVVALEGGDGEVWALTRDEVWQLGSRARHRLPSEGVDLAVRSGEVAVLIREGTPPRARVELIEADSLATKRTVEVPGWTEKLAYGPAGLVLFAADPPGVQGLDDASLSLVDVYCQRQMHSLPPTDLIALEDGSRLMTTASGDGRAGFVIAFGPESPPSCRVSVFYPRPNTEPGALAALGPRRALVGVEERTESGKALVGVFGTEAPAFEGRWVEVGVGHIAHLLVTESFVFAVLADQGAIARFDRSALE